MVCLLINGFAASVICIEIVLEEWCDLEWNTFEKVGDRICAIISRFRQQKNVGDVTLYKISCTSGRWYAKDYFCRSNCR